jgi:rod shape-determining protein MreC
VAYQQRNRRRTILVLLVLTALTLITLDQRAGGGGVIGTVRDGARDVLAPVQDLVGGVTRPVGNWFEGIFEAGSLRDENAELRRELDEVRGRLARAEGVLRENEELRALLALDFVGDIPLVEAEVVNVSAGNFESTVQIDRGTNDGVAVGMPVVAGEGLVGRVSQASRRRSTVLLISDPSAGVGARLSESQRPGVLRGTGSARELRLDFIDPDVDVADGELVVTSGVDQSTYPAGIPIGRVVRAASGRGALQQEIAIQPLVDLERLRFLAVVRWPLVNLEAE